MDIKEYLFQITSKSLWLLLAEYAPITIIGIENPYQGWLVEDIEADADKSIQVLKEQGLLTVDEDESYELIPSLRQAVDMIAKPETVLITLDSSSGIAQEQTYSYLNQEEALYLEHTPEGLKLQHFSSHPELIDLLFSKLPLPEDPKDSTSFNISEEVFFQIALLSIQAKYNEALNLLDDTDLSEAARKELMEAFQDRQANASFAILKNATEADTQQVTGFGLLAGGDRLWSMKPIQKLSKTFVALTPATPEKLRAELAMLL